LYNEKKQDSFYDRLIIFFFHLSFLLKEYKNIENKEEMQKFFDFCVRQIELSIREIGYGDATINKKMKDYVNLLFSIIDKIDKWNSNNNDEKLEIFKIYIPIGDNGLFFIDYFEKYRNFIAKNSFNSLSKDIINL